MNTLMPQKSSSKTNILFYFIKISIYTIFIFALSILIVNSFQEKNKNLILMKL